jgi:hypothetical protein
MSALAICEPQNLQCGDTMVINQHLYLVTSIEGPDRIGTYDVMVVDGIGNKRAEIVLDPVIIKCD